jgi:hypothetical protein
MRARLAKVVANRRVLVVVPCLVILGACTALSWAWYGSWSRTEVGELADGTLVRTEQSFHPWWFYPLTIGGMAMVLVGVLLVPAHFVVRARHGKLADAEGS